MEQWTRDTGTCPLLRICRSEGVAAEVVDSRLGQETHPLRPGSVAVIPAGVLHSLEASEGEELEFVIFGTPPMAMDDERARAEKA